MHGEYVISFGHHNTIEVTTMHARKVSHKILFNTLPWIHETRINALHECLLAAIASQRLSVTGIGRSINSVAKEKHCIKRADRLLSNHHLWAEREGVSEFLCVRRV